MCEAQSLKDILILLAVKTLQDIECVLLIIVFLHFYLS